MVEPTSTTKATARIMPGLVVLALGGICGLLLIFVAAKTQEPIKLNREVEARRVFEELLGPTISTSIDINAKVLGDCSTFRMYRATTRGYAAEIEVIGVWYPSSEPDTLGALSMRTVRHLETPGIGDFIGRNTDWMSNLDRSGLDVWQSVDNVSGATVTTNAIRRLVSDIQARAQVDCGAPTL